MCLGRGYYSITAVKDGETLIESIDGAAVSFYDPGTSITGDPIYQAGARFNTAPKITVKSNLINGQSLEKPNEAAVRGGVYFTSGGVINRLNTSIDFRNYFSVNQGIAITNAEFLEENIILSGVVTFTPTGELILSRSSDIADIDKFKAVVVTGATHYKDIETTDPITQEVSIERIYYDLSATYSILSATKSASGSNFIYTIELSSPELTNPSWSHVDADVQLNVGLELTDSIESMILDGFYTVGSVSSSSITLINPEAVNQDWDKLDQIFNGTTFSLTTEKTILVEKLNNKWVGWFDLELEGATQCVFNLTLPAGISNVTNKGEFTHAYVENWLQCEAYGEDGEKIGNTINTVAFFQDATRDQISKTFFVNLPAGTNRVRFRAAKVRAETRNSPVTETKLKSVFLTKDLDKLVYPGLTMVRSKTLATAGALSVKERKLNCLVTRKLPLNGTGALTATNSAAQALIYLALDEKNGRRSINEVDVSQILAEEQAVINYFGNAKAAEFSYTIDDNNLSFEEIAGMVASSMFCEAYRYGNKLRVRFEQPQQNSVLLFNAANKAPNTEKRTKNFGIDNKYDGIEIEYTSPDDDTRITYVASDDENPINTMQIKTSGIRSHEQAKTRAWREWNKLKYRNTTCEFEALEESELLARNDRILVADNTVVKTKDGIIDNIDGLTLGLSHPIESDVPYFIYLQLADGRVDIVPCSYTDEYTVLLSRPPLIAIVPEFTTYQLIESTETPSNAFMVTEIRPQGKMTNMLTCVNYDERYYQNDADFF